ncbi:NADH dehydrogenase [ubiquinone] 1 alpha subcomplex subunit 5, mitochondrial [Balamuthia mandrillaris]
MLRNAAATPARLLASRFARPPVAACLLRSTALSSSSLQRWGPATFPARTFASEPPKQRKVKESTGIPGLDVVPNAREVLIALYKTILKEIQAVPEEAGYRKIVEKLFKERLQIVQENEDVEQIEEIIGLGVIEELIIEAQNELSLIPDMLKVKPWDVPENHKIPIVQREF